MIVVKAGLVTGLLVTLVSALVFALISGAGTDSEAVGFTFPNLLEVSKAAILLCPITAVSCGFPGLIVGIAGAAVAFRKRGEFQVTSRFLFKSVMVGLLLAAFWPVGTDVRERMACILPALLGVLISVVILCVQEVQRLQWWPVKKT